MRIALVSVLLLLGIYSPISFSAVYNVDPTQSYISVQVPKWEKGFSWSFLLPDGSERIAGYQWITTLVDEKFTVSGNIEVLMQPVSANNGQPGILINAQNLSSPAPAELNFNITSNAGLNPIDGVIASDFGCVNTWPGGSVFCQTTMPSTPYSGTLHDDNLTLTGGRYGVFFGGEGSVWGGLESPPAQAFSYSADTLYSFHLVATMVPEPNLALMLVAGLLLLLRSNKRSSEAAKPR